MVRWIILAFKEVSKCWEPQAHSSRPIPLGFQNQRYTLPASHKAPSGSFSIDKVIFALGIMTFIVQNIDFMVHYDSKMLVVDSYSQSLAKLEI